MINKMVKKFGESFGSSNGRTINENELSSIYEALDKSQAIIKFNPDGTIITVNTNFLNTVGYELSDIQGQDHRMFVEKRYEQSEEYSEFWASLVRGEYQAAAYKRFGKDGAEIWIQASYNPIFNNKGEVVKVIKFATNITKQVLLDADRKGQVDAISKSQAVIEFELDGTILNANENFLKTLGYTLEEIKGKHHSLFVDQATKESNDYKVFWETLAKGDYQSAEFRRIDKDGNDVWIQASYNPILGPNGKPFKVVKYATNTTEQVLARKEAERVGALVDENLDKILTAVVQANEQSTTVASASTQTMETVQTVSAATQQFEMSSREIAQSMEKSRVEVGKTRKSPLI